MRGVRGGPTLTPPDVSLAGGMLASYICSFLIFQGSTQVLLWKPYFFFFNGAGVQTPCPPLSVSAYGVGQLLRTFSIAAYTVLEGTHNLVVVYDRQIGKFKTLVNRNNGFN